MQVPGQIPGRSAASIARHPTTALRDIQRREGQAEALDLADGASKARRQSDAQCDELVRQLKAGALGGFGHRSLRKAEMAGDSHLA